MIGMLWFDRDPKAGLEEKILKALKYHKEKYQALPEVCLVNTEDAKGNQLDAISKKCGVAVKPYRFIQPNNLWLGAESAAQRMK